MKEYSREFQNEVALEIEALPATSKLPTVVVDYAVLRAQIRAANKAR